MSSNSLIIETSDPGGISPTNPNHTFQVSGVKTNSNKKRKVQFIKIEEDEMYYNLNFNFAGYDKNEISVETFKEKKDTNNFVKVRWEEDDNYNEYIYDLPKEVLIDSCEATFYNGMLYLSFDKDYESKIIDIS